MSRFRRYTVEKIGKFFIRHKKIRKGSDACKIIYEEEFPFLIYEEMREYLVIRIVPVQQPTKTLLCCSNVEHYPFGFKGTVQRDGLGRN